MSAPVNAADKPRAAAGRRLDGALSFDTVPGLWREVRVWADDGDAGSEIGIDLSGVTRADSAGLALLIELQRLARTHGRTLKFQNIPAQLRQLIYANGLEAGLNQAPGAVA